MYNVYYQICWSSFWDRNKHEFPVPMQMSQNTTYLIAKGIAENGNVSRLSPTTPMADKTWTKISAKQSTSGWKSAITSSSTRSWQAFNVGQPHTAFHHCNPTSSGASSRSSPLVASCSTRRKSIAWGRKCSFKLNKAVHVIHFKCKQRVHGWASHSIHGYTWHHIELSMGPVRHFALLHVELVWCPLGQRLAFSTVSMLCPKLQRHCSVPALGDVQSTCHKMPSHGKPSLVITLLSTSGNFSGFAHRKSLGVPRSPWKSPGFLRCLLFHGDTFPNLRKRLWRRLFATKSCAIYMMFITCSLLSSSLILIFCDCDFVFLSFSLFPHSLWPLRPRHSFFHSSPSCGECSRSRPLTPPTVQGSITTWDGNH